MNNQHAAIQGGSLTYFACILRMVSDASSQTCRVEVRPMDGGPQQVFGDLGQAFEFLQQHVPVSAETKPR